MGEIEINHIKDDGYTRLALLEERIHAGFPSPSQGAAGDTIDLNREVIKNPSSTFCARVIGDSMIEYGINEGDLLIIDKSLSPCDGNIAVCFIDGDFTVKRIAIRNDGLYLVPGNKAYPSIRITEENNFQIWGIVSHIVKKVL